MKFLKLPEGSRFSNRDLIIFILPVLFEQFMMAGLGIADTFMVSYLGESALAGVALVNRIDNFAKQFFLALAQGGSVILSMYIGAEDKKNARIAMKSNIRIVFSIGLAIMAVMVLFSTQILDLLYGNAEAEVLAYSNSYFNITALSYPLIALYYSASASFRAMGESRVPFIASVSMMSINLVLKYIFIFLLELDVVGAALSTLIAMGIVGITLLIMLARKKKNGVYLETLFEPKLHGGTIKRILSVSVPNGIEQGMFQLGALLIAGLISGLGTDAINADQIARNITPLIHSVGAGFAAAMMMVIGQCMGAGKPEEATMYTKHILKLDYLMTIGDGILFLTFLKPIISIFPNLSEQTVKYTYAIAVLYIISSCIAYPTSFAVASALRGAGDTKFVMVVASLSMFLFRIGAAYIFAKFMGFGVIGAWMAMVSDWVIRSIIFIIRFKQGKWKRKKVI